MPVTPTLVTCITRSLHAGTMHSDLPAVLIENGPRLRIHDEGQSWDYKATFDPSQEHDVAALAKDILAFHNASGGAIIIGVDKAYNIIGVTEHFIVDTATLHNKFRKYIGPTVQLFQDRIELPGGRRWIWLLFVRKRQGLPIACQVDGPLRGGHRAVRKNEYFKRVADESRTCGPAEIEALFLGTKAPTNVQPYLFDVDEPFFRTFTQYCDKFIGRSDLITRIHDELLRKRQPVLTLDGVGGVGKTALAIRVSQQLYLQRDLDCIISISAKSSVWTMGHTFSMKPGFSGLTELLTEIASVLQLPLPPQNPDADVTSQQLHAVRDALTGIRGLLLIDNLEAIHDESVFDFLDDVPAPMKVLITSRIDKGIGQKTLSVPAMNYDEARELLYQELDSRGYHDYLNESAAVDEILSATGCVPLAICWGAALAHDLGSVRAASTKLRGSNPSKKQFLSFGCGYSETTWR